ncbi:MAG TPA: hypothetical protein VIF62_21925 [Labilithrix sp.]
MGFARVTSMAAIASAIACAAPVETEEAQPASAAEETAPAAPVKVHRRIDFEPVPHGMVVPDALTARNETPATPALVDHGGRVAATIHFYLLFWGTGFEPTTPSLYATFLGGLGASAWWTIDSQYLRGAANHASFVKSYTDAHTAPSSTVSDAALRAELARVIAAGSLPYDANGVYYVVTPKNVKVCSNGACSCENFCGYHSAFASTAGVVLYAAIPSAAACPSSCGVFASDATSPNRNVEADEGVSIMAHEGAEAQSDAYGDAWFDGSGWENGDKCAYTYGTTTRAANGAAMNAAWGGKSWLVQMNWSNRVWACVQR